MVKHIFIYIKNNMGDFHDNYNGKKHTDSINYKIGRKIKYWRLERKYTQKDLADKLGVSQQQIQRYEKGINLVPIYKLCAIAKALLVGIEVLLKPAEKELSSLMGEYEKINN